MARIRMKRHRITFKEGCEMYLLNCRQRNLREGTIRRSRAFLNDRTCSNIEQGTNYICRISHIEIRKTRG